MCQDLEDVLDDVVCHTVGTLPLMLGFSGDMMKWQAKPRHLFFFF